MSIDEEEIVFILKVFLPLLLFLLNLEQGCLRFLSFGAIFSHNFPSNLFFSC